MILYIAANLLSLVLYCKSTDCVRVMLLQHSSMFYGLRVGQSHVVIIQSGNRPHTIIIYNAVLC